MHIPIDSTDAREQRELEAERAEAERAEDREHAEQCRGGFLGEDADGRPIVCPRCRPHLMRVACWTCGVAYVACSTQRATRRGPCCDACDHSRRARPAVEVNQVGGVSTTEGITDAPRSAGTHAEDHRALHAWTPGHPSAHLAHRLILVDDPDLGQVAVRWRAPRVTSPWTYRCTACQSYQARPECRHTFAAGLHLAQALLGLIPLNPRIDPQTSQEEHAS